MLVTTIDTENYPAQLAEKVSALSTLLAPFAAPELQVFASEPSHYRMRAEFRFWRQDNDMFYAMTDRKQIVRIDEFPIACPRINEIMPLLLAELKANPRLNKKLFQVEFLAATTNDCVVTLAYHIPVDDDWEQAAKPVAEKLGISLIGRSRGKKRVVGNDFVDEQFTVNGRTFTQRQPEQAFSQPNASTNQHMLNWACDVSRDLGGDLLELYCGNGNFTLPLATQFNRVLATEISTASVNALQHNVQANGLDNIQLARLSSEEFTQALNKEREFFRLKHIDLDSYQFNCVLVDPPRAGMDLASCQLIQAYDHIIYISCNPETLADNLQTLCQTHRIERACLFDQFPYTHHMEAGVFLKRK